MKIYIVTSGSYSDYHIDEVFTNLEQAQLYCATRNTAKYADYDIEEYDTDTCKLESQKPVKIIWKGNFVRNLDNKWSELCKFLYHWETFETRNEILEDGRIVNIYVTTDPSVSKEKVRRIMIDRFHQWKYENDKL
jgi:ketol-acid reductoisomerase